MEIRDFRFGSSRFLNNNNNVDKDSHEINYILLHPSMQTLLADINSITNDGNYVWTQEDKYTLESQLLLATADPLCLNPNLNVSIIKNKIHMHKSKMNSRKLKHSIYKIYQNGLKKKLKWSEYTLPHPFQILKIRRNCQLCNQIYPNEIKDSNKQNENQLNRLNFDEKIREQMLDIKKKGICLNIKVFYL